MNLDTDEPIAAAIVDAIHKGDVDSLQRLLRENPGLATVRLGNPDDRKGMSRSLLHVATDWPGHFPNGAPTVAALIAAGADVNARFTGPHTRRRFIGPQAVMMLRFSMRCWMQARTSKPLARSLAAARHWPMQWVLANGRRRGV
jgi:hypothetical protein